MPRRLVLLALIICLLPIPAFADLRDSVGQQATLAAQQQTASAPATHPYKKPAMVLMAGGAGLLVLGLLQERGAEVSTNQSGTAVSVKETGGSKTALTALGVAAGGGGAVLWFLGNNKRNASPFRIWWSPSGAGFSHSVGF